MAQILASHHIGRSSSAAGRSTPASANRSNWPLFQLFKDGSRGGGLPQSRALLTMPLGRASDVELQEAAVARCCQPTAPVLKVV
jgi:hypothetical protein